MFQEWEPYKLRVQALEDEIEQTEAKGLKALQDQRQDCQRRINSLQHCRKLVQLSNGVKWTAWWITPQSWHTALCASLDGGVSYACYRQADSWFWEFSWLSLGVALVALINYLYRKLGGKKQQLNQQPITVEAEVVA